MSTLAQSFSPALNAFSFPPHSFPLLPLRLLTVGTLSAIVAWKPTQPVAAATPSLPGNPPDRVTPTTIAAQNASETPPIAPPETLVAQQFSASSTPAGGENPQYYQEYQAVTVPTAPVSPPPAPSGATPLPPAENPQPTSLSEPIWVVPAQPQSPSSVTVPGIQAAPPTTPRATPPATPPTQTALSSELVVTATDVQVVGVDADLQRVVLDTIRTKPGGQTNSILLQQDVAEILDTGLFATASVSSRPNPNGISVIFQVTPTVVRSLRLSNAKVLTLDVANQFFQSQFGQPISTTNLNRSVQRINEWYRQNGYVLARVLTLQPTRDGVITIDVAEGFIGDVQVRFLNAEGKEVDENGQPIRVRTQPDFARSQIKLQPGEVFQEARAREDLQRLQALGIFEAATVTFEGDARRVNVIYNVVEGSPRRLNFGGGFSDDIGLYGAVSFTDTNFAGLAQRLGANVQVGTRDIQGDIRFTSPYRETDPDTPGYGVNVFRRQGISRVFDEEIRLQNGDRVRERRIGGGINLDKPLGPTWLGSLGVNYTNVSLRDQDGDVFVTDSRGNPLSFSGTGIDDLTTVSFTAVRDQRDSTINPGNGSILTLSSEQTIPIGRGEILGNRLSANYSYYIPVDLIQVPQPEQPQVLAFNLQGGTNLGDLPPYNAFTLGGPNSVRGYDFGDVASSRSYFLATAEYRFPIYRFIGGTVFADFGTDLGTSSYVLGEPGVQRGKPGSGFGVGAGVRINSPLGIVRLDLGFSDQGDTRLQFGFGQKF